MAAKMIKCKTCGADMAANAKACPQCGAKNKKPIYKKWWFYVLIVLVVIVIAGGSSNGDNKTAESKTASMNSGDTSAKSSNKTEPKEAKPTPTPVSYEHYDVVSLFAELKENAMKAKETHNKQYVEIEGFLSNIDSDGKYISVGAASDNWDYMFDSIHCNIKSDEQKKQIMEMKKDDPIIVRGRITDVGEVLGYYLDIDSIG